MITCTVTAEFKVQSNSTCAYILNSGERVRKPIDVKKPFVTGANVCASKVMSTDELLDMDDIEFQLHDYDNSPGVLLKKNSCFARGLLHVVYP